MSNPEAEFEKQKMQINRAELVARMTRAISVDGILEVFPGVFLNRFSKLSDPVHLVFKPAFCFIAQGSKEVFLGNESYRYDPGHYLISTVTLPIISRTIEASEEKPYLSFRVNLDAPVVASVMMGSNIVTKKSDANVSAMNVSPIGADLLDAVVRLAKLLDTPDEIPTLAPLIVREIIYRLLRSDQGARLGHLLSSEGETRRITRAVNQLRENIDQPLIIENMARELGMSVSSFHHHFKSVTAMSPVQFQKQIRLQEARRLMLGEELDVASAGSRVGYDNPAYFSREYKKLFGAPPQRDITKLRSELAQ